MGDFPFGMYPPQMYSHLSTNNLGSDEARTAESLSAAAYWSQLQGQIHGGPSSKNTDNDDGECDNEEDRDSVLGEMMSGESTSTTYPKMLTTSSSSSSLTTAYDGSEGSRDLKESHSLSTSPKKRRSKNKKSPQNPALMYEGWQSGFAAIAAASANHTSQAMGNLGMYFNFPWLLHGAQGAMMHQQHHHHQQHHQHQQASSSSGFASMNDSSSMTNVAGMRDGMMAPSSMGPPGYSQTRT